MAPHYLTVIAATRAEADAALLAEAPFGDGPDAPVLVGIPAGQGWELQLWTEVPPDSRTLDALCALAPSAGRRSTTQPVPDADWVSMSQSGLDPVALGRFFVHTGNRPGRPRPGQWPLRIDAGLAFGTGRHATTAGCVAAAARLARVVEPRSILDVGTGSGLLAIAAHRLFPKARITASDLDAVAIAVARANARLNGVPAGRARARLDLLAAPGIEHPRILQRAPYDLVFANILAGPLVALAPTLSAVVARGGHLVLAGLLAGQKRRVLAAYRARGLRPAWPTPPAEWPVLILRRARGTSGAAARRARMRPSRDRGWQIDTL
jgi:ribosomal protein L11 methyltransferase